MAPTYPLEDLLRVRRFREDEAAAQVTMCRLAVEQASQLVAERQQTLREYGEWRVRREAELYQELFTQQVQLKTLDDFKFDILQLRETEALHEDQVRAAQRELEAARNTLENARDQHRSAFRNVEKIGEHKEIWTQEVREEREAFEDRELEDFRVTRDDSLDDNDDGEDADDD